MDISFGEALLVFGALIVATGFHYSAPALIAFVLLALLWRDRRQ